MRGPTPRRRIYFSGVLVPAECFVCDGGWVVLRCGLKLSTGCAGSGASWEVQAKLLHVFCLAPQSMSDKAICRRLLLVLGWEDPRRGQAVNQGWLLLVLGLWPLSEKYGAC